MMDRLLRGVIKVSQASVTFTAFDDLFQHWLERMQMLGHSEEVRPISRSLQRF